MEEMTRIVLASNNFISLFANIYAALSMTTDALCLEKTA